MSISSIGVTTAQGLQGPAQPGGKSGQFSSLIKQYIVQQNQEHHAAGKAAMGLVDGSNQNVSQTLLAMKKADLSFQMMLAVRNKLVSAYHDVMRMQI